MYFILLVGMSLLYVAWLLARPWWVERRRTSLRQRPFPGAWRRILRNRVPQLAQLPIPLQHRLQKNIQVFLAEKPFLGCGGLKLTDEMRVTVAAQACLLLLGRPANSVYPNLRQILVYPGAFVVERAHRDGIGLLQDRRRHLSGESWSQGQVVLSWDDVVQGAADPRDGQNVVMHEFAHQLDQETGPANGAPELGSKTSYARWSGVFLREYADLQQRTQAGLDTLLGDYAATEPAEFFAVATETFFERPQRLADEHAALYAELQRFYGVDPRLWQV